MLEVREVDRSDFFVIIIFVLFFSFEKADTHRFEVPRMLLEEPQQLEAYILKTKDKYVYFMTIQRTEKDGGYSFCPNTLQT